MIINRIWAMPSSQTFNIHPIKQLVHRYIEHPSIDPFSHGQRIASITNDLIEDFDCDYHMDALDFIKLFDSDSFKTVLFDPPYSPRQVSEVYKEVGLTVNMETTQSSFWTNLKKEIARVTSIGGRVISCGWNSGGIGIKLGFQIEEILLIPHGGWHNDTIVTVEKKIKNTGLTEEDLKKVLDEKTIYAGDLFK